MLNAHSDGGDRSSVQKLLLAVAPAKAYIPDPHYYCQKMAIDIFNSNFKISKRKQRYIFLNAEKWIYEKQIVRQQAIYSSAPTRSIDARPCR